MDKLRLQLEPRTITGKKVKNLRKEGLVPASICGKGVANANFQLNAKTFGLVYRQAGRNTLIELETPQGTQSAFVRQVQIHPVRREFLHVDFRVVDLKVAMTADVPIVAVGQNELVERDQGVLSLMLQTLHVRGLPGDLPHTVEVDISAIHDFSTTLYVSDLPLSDNVEVLTPGDTAVATITASRMEAEEEAITEQEQAGEPELAAANADTDAEAGDTSDDAE